VPASEDNYGRGYMPSSEDYYYSQPEYMTDNNHLPHRKPLQTMIAPQVISRPLSPTRNMAKLKTQLLAETCSQPVAYRGEI